MEATTAAVPVVMRAVAVAVADLMLDLEDMVETQDLLVAQIQEIQDLLHHHLPHQTLQQHHKQITQ